MFARVVNLRLVIDVDTWSTFGGGFVEELAWEGVASVVSNIVIGEMDNVLTGNTVFEHNLDGVMGVSLMTVVAVGVGASHDDGPMGLGGSSEGSKSSGSEEGLHCLKEVVVCFYRKN